MFGVILLLNPSCPLTRYLLASVTSTGHSSYQLSLDNLQDAFFLLPLRTPPAPHTQYNYNPHCSHTLSGHSGYQLSLDNLQDALFLLLNPFLLIQLVAPNSARPMDHEDHHTVSLTLCALCEFGVRLHLVAPNSARPMDHEDHHTVSLHFVCMFLYRGGGAGGVHWWRPIWRG